MKAGDKITVPEFIYKGKVIDDPYVRLGEILTEIDSKDKTVKYFKVRLYHAFGEGYNFRDIIIRKDKEGVTVPDFKIKRRKKVKSELLPIFGEN